MCVCMGGVCAPYGISVEVADDVIDLPGWYGWCVVVEEANNNERFL